MKPLVIAHRGASGDAPENTMKAFELAALRGADGLELDIIMTHDKEIVVTHDENTRRITGHSLNIRREPLKNLRKLDFGQGEKIPTLDEVFGTFGHRFSLINVEIKTTGYGTDGIEQGLYRLIKRHHLEDSIYVSSFNPLNVYRMRRVAPEIKRGFLIWHEAWFARRLFWIKLCQVKSINLEHTWCTEKRHDYYKKRAGQIWVWTVNADRDMLQWSRKGVDAIITNFPGRLKTVLSEL